MSLEASRVGGRRRVDEGEDHAIGPRTRRTPRAVDVRGGVVGRIEVHDAGHTVDVHATRGDVGGDERTDLAAGERTERAVALGLRTTAVDCRG